jgi:hypothetical protein
MRIAAVLEIAPESTGALPTSLLGAAYRASAMGYIMLALRGVSPQAVDRILDPLVSASRNWRLNGVVYVDAQDEQFICSAARRARIVMASSDGLRARFDEQGIPHVDARGAIERLSELERGSGVAVPAGTPAVSVPANVLSA